MKTPTIAEGPKLQCLFKLQMTFDKYKKINYCSGTTITMLPKVKYYLYMFLSLVLIFHDFKMIV